jgi:2-methylisocitrate lyase-like PEP mutase family enzyme
MKDLKATRQRFRSMYDGFFVIPNAWNVGEIRQLEKLDFGAIATTSAGLSASMGRDDLSLSRDETLQNIRTLCAGTDLPVNADFESGFADDAAGVGANDEGSGSQPSTTPATGAIGPAPTRPGCKLLS